MPPVSSILGQVLQQSEKKNSELTPFYSSLWWTRDRVEGVLSALHVRGDLESRLRRVETRGLKQQVIELPKRFYLCTRGGQLTAFFLGFCCSCRLHCQLVSEVDDLLMHLHDLALQIVHLSGARALSLVEFLGVIGRVGRARS